MDGSAGGDTGELDAVETSTADFVFISPEQLASDDVVDRLRRARLSLGVVDEAHCVSAWDHDFRPDYRRLADIFRKLGQSIPVAALTATASVVVRRDIVGRLGLREPTVVIAGFDRPSLRLIVERYLDEQNKRSAVIDWVAALPGPGLLYTATRSAAGPMRKVCARRALPRRASTRACPRRSARKSTPVFAMTPTR